MDLLSERRCTDGTLKLADILVNGDVSLQITAGSRLVRTKWTFMGLDSCKTTEEYLIAIKPLIIFKRVTINELPCDKSNDPKIEVKQELSENWTVAPLQ